MRALRWIVGIAVAVVLLAIAAVLIAALVINPDRYKGEIQSAVRRETGRPFVLEGHLRLTWFPWLGVRTGAARLGNPPGAGGPDLLDWQSAAVRVRLLPLILHRQLEVGRIRIAGAAIHLRRGPDGQGNWEDLLSRLQSGGAPSTAAAGTHASPAPAATWGGLDLVSSSLDYVDERSGEHVSLTGWRLDAGPWRAGQPLSVSTSFLLHAGTSGKPASAGAADVLRLPARGVRVSLDVPRLEVRSTPAAVTVPRLSVEVADANLEGGIEASRTAAGGLTASGSVTAAAPSLRRLARALGIDMPALESPSALGALSLSGSWSYRDGALAVEPLTVRLDATTITGSAGWQPAPGPHAHGVWTFALRADQVDLDRYLTRPQPQKPLALPVSALRALHARGTLELDRARIGGTTLDDVRLQVE